MRDFILGIDLGGTNTKIAILDKRFSLIKRASFVTKDFSSQRDKLIKAIIGESLRLLKEGKISINNVLGLGIGVPGPVDFSKGIIHYLPNIPHWQNTPIKSILEKKLGIKVFVDNDVNLMALAEARLGAGRGSKNIVCMTLGTGVGGGLILEGELYRGASFGAGEIGHMPIIISGARCNCGGRGCLEQYVGNNFFLKTAKEKMKNKNITLEKLSGLARMGNKRAIAVYNDFCEYIGIALTGVVNLLNPQLIVIGGGLSASGKFIFKRIKEVINKRAMPVHAKTVRVIKAELGNDAGLIGAALLVKESIDQGVQR